MFVFTKCEFGPGSYSYWLGCQNILKHSCFVYLAIFSVLLGGDSMESNYFRESLEKQQYWFWCPPPSQFYYVNYGSDTLLPTLNLEWYILGGAKVKRSESLEWFLSLSFSFVFIIVFNYVNDTYFKKAEELSQVSLLITSIQ